MAVQSAGMLTPDDLNDTDGEVLDVLHEGRATPQYVADQLGVSRTYASERLKRLVEHDHVSKLASGLYELADDPRDIVLADEIPLDQLRDALADARAAHEQVNGDDLGEALERMAELLGVDDAESD